MPNEPVLNAAMGGKSLEVEYLDGTKETVTVRLLPMRAILKEWAALHADEPAMVEFLCGKEEGWADTIRPESHVAIIDAGDKLNDPTYAAWVTRQAADIEKAKKHGALLGLIPQLPTLTPSENSSSTAPPA